MIRIALLLLVALFCMGSGTGVVATGGSSVSVAAGGGSNPVVDCVSQGFVASANIIDIADPDSTHAGCVDEGDYLIIMFAMDGDGDTITSSGSETITEITSGERAFAFQWWIGYLLVGATQPTFTGDVQLDWTDNEGFHYFVAVVSGAGSVDSVSANNLQSSRSAISGTFTPTASDSLVLHFANAFRQSLDGGQGTPNTDNRPFNPTGTTCPDVDLSGNCEFELSGANGVSAGVAWENHTSGVTSTRTWTDWQFVGSAEWNSVTSVAVLP